MFAMVHLGIGDIEACIEYLQLAFDEHDPLVFFQILNPANSFAALKPFAQELAAE
jgi:hypothetical protein